MLRLVAGIIVFVVLAGGLALGFRPETVHSPGSDSAESGVDSGAPAVDPDSPFPLLALLDTADWRDNRKLLQPVDPLTLEPMEGYESIEFDPGGLGGIVEVAISPDGSMGAFIIHAPSDGTEPGKVELHIVDLVDWTVSTVTEWEYTSGYESAVNPQYSKDGSRLYWITRTRDTRQRVLWRWSRDDGSVVQLAELAPDFQVIDYRVDSDSGRWTVFGAPVEQNLRTSDDNVVIGDFETGDAQVFVVDIGTNEILRNISLDGIQTGSVPVADADGDAFPVYRVNPGLSWNGDGDSLAVAHPDASELSVIDLERGRWDQFTLDEGASWLDRLAGLFFEPVSAAVRGIFDGFAVYLEDHNAVASASAYEALSTDRTDLGEATHGPVWLVDLETGQKVWQTHVLGVVGLVRVPGTDRLIVHSASEIYPRGDFDENEEHALRMLDISTGDILNTLELPGRPLNGRRSMVVSSQYVYVFISTDTGNEVIVVDPDSLAEVGKWTWIEGEPTISRLLPLP